MSAVATSLTPIVCPFCGYPLPSDLVIQEGVRHTCSQCGQEISFEQLQAGDLARVASAPPYRYDEGQLDPSIDTPIEIVVEETIIEPPPVFDEIDIPDLEPTNDPEEIEMDYGDPEFPEPIGGELPDLPDAPDTPTIPDGEPDPEPVPEGGSDIS